MTRILALILAAYFGFGSLLPRSDFSQLWKLDDLISHYQLHEGQEGIAAFLWEHLTNPNGHEHSDQGTEHQGLPLQSLGDGLPHLVLAQPLALPNKTSWGFNSPVGCPDHLFPSDFTADIFQPPSNHML